MDNIDKIKTIIPKLKQQLLFLREREILFLEHNDDPLPRIDSSTTTTISSMLSSPRESETSVPIPIDVDLNIEVLQNEPAQTGTTLSFSDEYTIPALPSSLLQDIENGALHKFAAHHTNRQVLSDVITHDLTKNYNLFYPTHEQFNSIGKAIVCKLKLPLTKDNIGIWKDVIQTKLKRARAANPNHIDVQRFQSKYSKVGSGRPVKRMDGEIAQRDRQKQIMLINYDDDALDSIQIKAQKLREDTKIDANTKLHLWKETLHVRRRFIRDQSTSEILEEFPGYKDATMIFEEVKMTMGVDLRSVIRRQVPMLLEKIMSTPAFITDSPPIQLIRVLCKHFEETVHHIFSNTKPTTPYPTMIFIDDSIQIYLDFLPIVSTTSPDDALALLLALYAVFELNFNKNSRAVRLLYGVVFGDKRFLSNTTRVFIQEKNIDIYHEHNRKALNNTDVVAQSSNTIDNGFQTPSPDMSDSAQPSTTEDIVCSPDNNSNVTTTIVTNEVDDKIEEPISCNGSLKQQANCRKRQRQRHLATKSATQEKITKINNDIQDESRENLTTSIDLDLQYAPRQTTKRKRRY